MKDKISKTNDSAAFFNARLDEIRMSGYQRVRAKAHLARAEAMADLLAAIAAGIARLPQAFKRMLRVFTRLLRVLIVRPFRRLTGSMG